jgi:hypothetical protein
MTEHQALASHTANLLAWLYTMRQADGYGGPVSHWWQNRFRYTGVGLDWRYEGILTGFALLANKTGDVTRFQALADRAVADLQAGQLENGHFRASRFEINPASLGTPHEAAASLGILHALPLLSEPDAALACAKRNVDALVRDLWDAPRHGFNDGLTSIGRVPNKLATFAQTLMTLAEATGDERYLDHARAALTDVVKYQNADGAIHQYAAGAQDGDGRFFPYYNARCVPPLMLGAKVLADEQFAHAAQGVLEFLERTKHEDGAWSQIIYSGGSEARWARWYAGTADTLLAYHAAGKPLPDAALQRLLAAQLASGGFMTAEGFAAQISQRYQVGKRLNHRDVIPVVGWNDKVLRLLATLLPDGTSLPEANPQDVNVAIKVGRVDAIFEETSQFVRITAQKNPDKVLYDWKKSAPWAHIVHFPLEVR